MNFDAVRFVSDPSKKYAGECQACGRRQSLFKGTGLVHHGYERPGDGYIVGDCAGVGHQPYELSCELTKTWAAQVRVKIAALKVESENLRFDRVEVLDVITQQEKGYNSRDNSRPEGEGWTPVTKRNWGTVGWKRINCFQVKRDHVPSAERGEREVNGGNYPNPGHNFEYYRQARIKRVTAWIIDAESDLVQLERRIKEWVYAPEKLTIYQGSKKATVVHMGSVRNTWHPICSNRMGESNAVTTSEGAKVTCTRCLARLGRRAAKV